VRAVKCLGTTGSIGKEGDGKNGTQISTQPIAEKELIPQWIEAEGIPLIEGFFIEDLVTMSLYPWEPERAVWEPGSVWKVPAKPMTSAFVRSRREKSQTPKASL
jgi:hypothetical protein